MCRWEKELTLNPSVASGRGSTRFQQGWECSWIDLQAVGGLKSKVNFLQSDDRGWKPHSLKAPLQGAWVAFVCWSHWPQTRGSVEVVGLDEGILYRSGTAALITEDSWEEVAIRVCCVLCTRQPALGLPWTGRRTLCQESTGTEVEERNGSLVRRQWPEVNLLSTSKCISKTQDVAHRSLFSGSLTCTWINIPLPSVVAKSRAGSSYILFFGFVFCFVFFLQEAGLPALVVSVPEVLIKGKHLFLFKRSSKE